MRLILVPLDSSLFAERALPVALDLAARHHARVVLVAVHQPTVPVRGGQGAMVFDQRYDQDMRGGLSQYLDETAAKIRADDATVNVDVALLDGTPVTAIDAYANEHGADLIVITSHGRTGPARWLLGSVADGLVRTLRRPVLIVRVDEASTESVAMPFQRVLVALDGTEESEAAIARAAAIVGNPNAHFTLLYVSPPLHPVLRLLASANELARDTDEQQAEARRYLDDAATRAAPLGTMQTALAVNLHPAHGIASYAAEEGMDLIVLSTHGRGPVGRAFLGSVADKVVRTAQIPVLLCHVPRGELIQVT